MYKTSSRNLQHSHRVGRPMPTGGLMGNTSAIDQDFIPSASNMSLEDCRAELRQLGVELVRAENELATAKRSTNRGQQEWLGHRIQTLVQRRSVIKSRVTSIREQNDPSETLAEAIRQVATAEVQRAIFQRARALDKEKYGA